MYTIADKFGHFYTLELVMVHCCSLPAACAHPCEVQRHHPMDIYKIGIGSSFPDTLPICLLLNNLFLDLGLGDDHGLKVLPLGDLSLELCDDGGDVKLVL